MARPAATAQRIRAAVDRWARTRELTVQGQSKLVRHARTKAFVEFAEIVGRRDAFGDPHRAERRHRDAHERRDAIIFEKDGVVHVLAKGGTFHALR